MSLRRFLTLKPTSGWTTLPASAKEGSTLFDNTKDTALNMIGQGTTLAKDLLQAPKADKWSPDEQWISTNCVEIDTLVIRARHRISVTSAVTY